MGLFEEAEDGEGHVVAVGALELALLGVDAGLVDAAQERGDDNLLLSALDFIQLDEGTHSRPEELVQFDIFEVVEDAAFAQGGAQPPDEGAGCGIVIGGFILTLRAVPHLAHGPKQLFQSIFVFTPGAYGVSEGAAQLVVHLL